MWVKYFVFIEGDSRCVLGRRPNIGQPFVSEDLSTDHKPDCPLEKERILSRGGRVETYYDFFGKQIGPYRVWLKDEQVPGLAMSRSFGDLVASSVGVICEPGRGFLFNGRNYGEGDLG